MQEIINEIKYDRSVRFLRKMFKQEKLTAQQEQTAEKHLRKVYGIIL
jgi:hypothetical protein